MGCYLSDGVRLIDYVLVYDLDKRDDDGSDYEEEENVISFLPLSSLDF